MADFVHVLPGGQVIHEEEHLPVPGEMALQELSAFPVWLHNSAGITVPP